MGFTELGGPFFQIRKLGLEAGEFGEAIAPVGVDFLEMGEGVCLRDFQVGDCGVEGLGLRGVFGGEEGAGEGRRCGAVFGEEARGGLARGGDAHEAVGERGRDLLRLREECGGFQFQEMAESRGGFAEGLVGGVELCEVVCVAACVGVGGGAAAVKFFPQIRVVEPRTAGDLEKGEGVWHGRRSRQVLAGGTVRKPILKCARVVSTLNENRARLSTPAA